jgi:MerR family transcriptional regulator, light-induced transcriptional regulator
MSPSMHDAGIPPLPDTATELPERREFIAAALAGDRARAETCARAVFELRGVEVLYEEIVRPAVTEVGGLWFEGRISIAQEHLAMATAQSAVAALYPLFPWPKRGPRALIACVEGDQHEFGARMVSDLLALDGWDERYLGASVSVAELVQTTRELKPRLLGLSVTLPVFAPAARRAIRCVRETYPEVKILAGGRAGAAELGAGGSNPDAADAVARSGAEAVRVARAWK